MGKPKRIRRHGPTGPQELSQALTPAATDEELMRACLELGQTPSQAEETISMYKESILDGADVALMEEVVKENRAKKLPPGMVFKREQPAMVDGKRVVRSEAKTKGPIHKQKVTRRNRFGTITGIEEDV